MKEGCTKRRKEERQLSNIGASASETGYMGAKSTILVIQYNTQYTEYRALVNGLNVLQLQPEAWMMKPLPHCDVSEHPINARKHHACEAAFVV